MMKREIVIPMKEKKYTRHCEDSWLWTNIFWTRCTLEGKVSQVIVDGGICENMVSREMVDELKLHYEKIHVLIILHFSKMEMKILYW